MTPPKEKSAYEILGLHKGSTIEEIKQAWVVLVKKYDPEMHTDRFMIIQKAYDQLKDPVSRAREDVKTFNYVKGEFFFNKEEKTEAPEAQISQIIQSMEQKREAGEPMEQIGPKLVQGYMLRSWKNVQKKLWAEAIEDWNRVLELDPTHRRAKNNLLYSYITLGYSYAQHGLYDEAVDVWKNGAQMNPDDSRLIHNLALASELAGRFDDAGRYWQEVVKRWKISLEHQPDDEYLKNLVIEALRQHGEKMAGATAPAAGAGAGAAGAEKQPVNGATAPAVERPRGPRGIDEYREILKLKPDDFEARFKIANHLMENKVWNEASAELQELQKRFPRNLEVMNLLGWALLNEGKVDDGFTVWRKAKIIEPGNFQITESLIKAHMHLGRMLREKGHYTPSLVHFKSLTKLMPDSVEVHYEIAKTYQAQGNERSAFLEYQTVMKMDPKHKEARNAMSSLKMKR